MTFQLELKDNGDELPKLEERERVYGTDFNDVHKGGSPEGCVARMRLCSCYAAPWLEARGGSR